MEISIKIIQNVSKPIQKERYLYTGEDVKFYPYSTQHQMT